MNKIGVFVLDMEHFDGLIGSLTFMFLVSYLEDLIKSPSKKS